MTYTPFCGHPECANSTACVRGTTVKFGSAPLEEFATTPDLTKQIQEVAIMLHNPIKTAENLYAAEILKKLRQILTELSANSKNSAHSSKEAKLAKTVSAYKKQIADLKRQLKLAQKDISDMHGSTCTSFERCRKCAGLHDSTYVCSCGHDNSLPDS